MIILIGYMGIMYTFSVWVLYYFSFCFCWGGGLVIGTFVLGSLGWYILLGLGFVILCTLFCLWEGIGRCSHYV